MLDKDNLTYGPSKRNNAFSDSKQTERALLTTDRSQKLDLLIHLLTNLRQSLIVCGPDGIGKTTLIKTLQDRRRDIWPICVLQGSPTLSFESVITELSQFLNLSDATIRFDISSVQAYCAKQKVVLIIDDAGELVPGLIGELIDFADSLAGLRLVFAMNYDEFQQKSDSDQTVDTCHFIELPPLNQRQCLEYLQNLSVQPGATLSFNAVTDALVESLYRKTDGIPGKLLAEFPMMERYQSRQHQKFGLWLGTLLILVSGSFIASQLLPPATDELKTNDIHDSVATNQSRVRQTLEIRKSAPTLKSQSHSTHTIDTAIPGPSLFTPQITPTITTGLTAERNSTPSILEASRKKEPNPLAQTTETPAEPKQNTLPSNSNPEQTVASAKTESKAGENPPANATPLEQKTTPSPEKPDAPITKEEIKEKPENQDLEWIMAQPATNYTVQLMVLSYKNSVDRFMRKHADYRDSLKYFTIGRSGQEKYVLIYGSFQSATDALKRKSTMPTEFNQGIVKRFTFIQKQSRRK